MNVTVTIGILAVLLILANVHTYQLMRIDKRLAKRGERRISEKQLFIAAACFGALGGVIGMQRLRHKTKHLRFKIGFPLLLVGQAALLIWGGVLLAQGSLL